MKILLTTLNSKFIHSNLAIKYLSKCLRLTGAETREYTINEDIEEIFYSITSKGCDIVAFSCYIWNIERTLKITENLKKANPELIILLGGPEVSFEVKDFMKEHPHIDMVVSGEGEDAFFELDHILSGYGKINKLLEDKTHPMKLVDVCSKKLLEIPNLYFRNQEGIQNGASEEEQESAAVTKDLDKIPRPYTNVSKEEIENKIVYYETSRGCTFNCAYCLSATSKGIRYFSQERVFEDLKNLVELGAGQIKFVDRTFNSDAQRAKNLVEYLMAIDDGKINFHFEITAYLLQDSLLEILKHARVGLFQFEIGVQSTNSKTLLAVNRANQFEKLKNNVQQIKSFGNIHQHLDLIAGLPYEGLSSLKDSFNQVFDLQVEALQLGFLKLLKGSPIYYQVEEYQYQYRNYPPYEVIANRFISAKELMMVKKVENALDRYYNKGRYKNSIRYLYSFYPQNGYQLFDDLQKIIDEEQIDLSQKNQEFFAMYLLVKKLKSTKKELKLDFFVELLRLDYLMMGRNPNLPDFLKRDKIAPKEDVFQVLKQEQALLELGFDKEIASKEAFKKIQWSNFSYDVLKYSMEDKIENRNNLVIINYDYQRKGDERFPGIGRDYEI